MTTPSLTQLRSRHLPFCSMLSGSMKIYMLVDGIIGPRNIRYKSNCSATGETNQRITYRKGSTNSRANQYRQVHLPCPSRFTHPRYYFMYKFTIQ